MELTPPTGSTLTIDQIYNHRSIRDYLPDPVPAEMVSTIVAAGQRASTSSNLQNYSVVVVQDPDRRRRLAELCGNQAHITVAPVFLTWCADLHRLGQACEIRGYTQITAYVENFLVAAIDAALVMQTASLAAESLGLGICYIGGIRNHPAEVIELLGLPKLVFPLCGMTLGWPAKKPAIKLRLPLPAVLHWEYYQPDQRHYLRVYDSEMAASGIYKDRQLPVPGVPGEVADYSWSEHSARRVSRPHRHQLRQVLSEQGFALE